jgi:hypothetical protein
MWGYAGKGKKVISIPLLRKNARLVGRILDILAIFAKMPSFLRKQVSKKSGLTLYAWIPAFAGRTKNSNLSTDWPRGCIKVQL